jgi:hypothetical protein
VGAADVGEVIIGPGHLQGGEIQKLDGGDELVDGFGGEFAFVEEVELILADGFDIEHFGTPAEVPGETGHVMDILLLCAGRKIAQLHIVDHALS